MLSIVTAPDFYLLLAQRILGSHALVGLSDHACNDGDKHENCDEAGDEAGTDGAGGDKSTDLVYEECNGEAGCELKANAAPEPLAIVDLRVHCTESSKARRSVKVEHMYSTLGVEPSAKWNVTLRANCLPLDSGSGTEFAHA